MSTKKYYTIQITGGTSPGPYTVYYGVFPTNPPSASSIVPKVYPITTPPTYAQNLGLSALTGNGIIVEVPLSTTVLYLYNQLCPENTITLVPTNSIVYKDFCMQFENRTIFERIQFTYAGVNTVVDDVITGPLPIIKCSIKDGILFYNPNYFLISVPLANFNFTVSPIFTLSSSPLRGGPWWGGLFQVSESMSYQKPKEYRIRAYHHPDYCCLHPILHALCAG